MSCRNARPLDRRDVQTQLGGHDPGDVRRLHQVLQDVLAVAGAVAQPAEQGGQLRVQVGDADVDEGFLGGAVAELVDLALRGVEDLLDAVRVDPPVEDQFLQGQPAHLAAYRVEAGQQHGLGGVVDDQVDPGHRFEGPDVATLATDDPALHLVAGQVQDADHALGGLLTGDPLDGVDHDVPGPGVGGVAGVALDVTDEDGGFPLGLDLDHVDEFAAGRVGGQAGDPLQLPTALLLGGGDLRLPYEQGALALGEVDVHGGEALLALDHPSDLVGVLPFSFVDPGGAAFHVGGVLLGCGVEQGHLALAAASRGRADLFGVGLGLPVGVLEDGVGLGVRGFEHPARLGAGGGRFRLRGGGLGADGGGDGLGVVDGMGRLVGGGAQGGERLLLPVLLLEETGIVR